MWDNLNAFYLSSQWRNLRAELIMTRADPTTGILYDEHNGKPLLHSHDIVAHHIEPITLRNVNDYSISLNPHNILLVSHRSHNEIHARYGFSMLKKVYYVYGAPCSGKSSFVMESKGNSDLVVDIDLLWQALTGGVLYEKPDALRSAVFALRDTLLDQVKTRAGKWERAWVIEGGAVKAERERRLTALGAEPIFVDTPKETCLQRLASDNKRLYVREQWGGYIEKWFDQYQP